MNEYKPELLKQIANKPFEELSAIEKVLLNETDWRLQNKGLVELSALRTRLYILENLREQVSRQAKADKDGRAKVNTFEAARLALLAENLEPEQPETLQCQHGNPINAECPECRKISISLNQPPRNNRVA